VKEEDLRRNIVSSEVRTAGEREDARRRNAEDVEPYLKHAKEKREVERGGIVFDEGNRRSTGYEEGRRKGGAGCGNEGYSLGGGVGNNSGRITLGRARWGFEADLKVEDIQHGSKTTLHMSRSKESICNIFQEV